jgi:peroxiredoxin
MVHTKIKPGDKAPDFTLTAVDGSTFHLAEALPHFSATVVLYLCNHCPYVQAYIPRLIAMQKEFADKVRFVGICSNDAQMHPEDDFPHMEQAAARWGLNFPYLRDESQGTALAYGAERTPEVFVFDAAGICRYEGGIDDNYQNATRAQERPLHDALAALVQGRPVPRAQSFSIGCAIKWKN